jgi:hypothetical protein
MAMGGMGASGFGGDTDKAMALLELLADPAKSKARLEDFGRREQAARQAEADHKRAAQEARDAVSHAQQTSEALNQRYSDLENRTSSLAIREQMINTRENAVAAGERDLGNKQRAFDADQKRREAEYEKEIDSWRKSTDQAKANLDAVSAERTANLDQREIAVALGEERVKQALADAEKVQSDALVIRNQHQAKLDELNKRIARFSQEVAE